MSIINESWKVLEAISGSLDLHFKWKNFLLCEKCFLTGNFLASLDDVLKMKLFRLLKQLFESSRKRIFLYVGFSLIIRVRL